MVDAGAYTDSNGFLVDVGVVVSYDENFVTPGMPDLSYVVVSLPNMGDMVEMSQCDMDESGNPVNVREEVISVQPWKVGAI